MIPWKPLAGGMSNGRLLVLQSAETLTLVTPKPFGAGYYFAEIPLAVLEAARAPADGGKP